MKDVVDQVKPHEIAKSQDCFTTFPVDLLWPGRPTAPGEIAWHIPAGYLLSCL